MIKSPTLLSMLAAHNSPNAAFWTDIERVRTPIIEDCADPSKRLVTFLYRAEHQTSNVVLLCALNRQDLTINRLTCHEQTDLWFLSLEIDSGMRTKYLFNPNDSLEPLTDDDVLSQRASTVCVDRFNPKLHTIKAYEDDPTDNDDTLYSLLELPGAPTLKYTIRREGTPQGRVSKHRFHSDILGNEHAIWAYQPHASYATDRTRLMIVFDGWNYTTAIPTPTILDNLIQEGVITPTSAIFIEPDLWEDRGKELAFNDRFTNFLAAEILPWHRQLTGFSPSPESTILAGSSLGGLAACYTALHRPDLFGCVLSQSCAVQWENSRIIREFNAKPKQKLRMYFDMGTLE